MPSAQHLSFTVPHHLHWRTEDLQMHRATARRLSEAGANQVILIAPDRSVKMKGMLTYEECDKLAQAAKRAAAIYTEHGIDTGVWYCPTFKVGPNPFAPNSAEFATYDFQRITDLSGTVSPHSCCPHDPKFQQYFSKCIKTIAAACKPSVILLEDDFELSNHPGVTFGCFCPRHVASFAKRIGKTITREDLYELFQQPSPEAVEMRAKWAAFACDTLVELATHLRQAVDAVSPQTRIALCEPGCTDFDGEMTLPVARALAGNTQPMVRGCGSAYSSDDPTTLPANIFHSMLVSQQRDPDVQWLHESDTYPHTGYYSSAARISSLVTNAIMAGADGALYYALQGLDNPCEETRYLDALQKRRPWWQALRDALHDPQPAGVQIIFRRDTHNHRPYCPAAPIPAYAHRISPWARILGHHGIPFTTHNAHIKCVAGESIAAMSEQQLDELFASPVLLDGRAAYLACQRGRAEDLGLTASPMTSTRSLRERLTLPADWGTLPGKEMYFLQAVAAGTEASSTYTLTPHAQTQSLSEFVTPDHQPDGCAMTLHHNARGGHVITMAFDVEDNLASSIFNYRRAWLLRRLIAQLSPEAAPVMADRDPKIFSLACKTNAGRSIVLSLTNLSLDPTENVSLAVHRTWENATYEHLSPDGTWASLSPTSTGDGFAQHVNVQLELQLHVAQPVIVRINNG